MKSRNKLVLILTLMFVLCICIAALNVSVFVSFIFFILSMMSLFLLVATLNGMYTGYFEEMNKEFRHAIDTTYTLFRCAKNSIKIYTGSLIEEFYSSEEIMKAFEQIPKSVSIEIIISNPNFNVEDHKLLKYLLENHKLSIWKLEKKVKDGHFIIVDDEHVRLEDPHTDEENTRRAEIKYITLYLGKKLSKKFDKFKEKSTKLNLS